MNKLAELRKKEIMQANPFLEMQKSFTDVLELRIFFLAQTDVRPHLPGVKDEGRWDKEFRTFRMPAAQVVELFTTEGTTRKNLYQRLKDACEGMIGSYVKEENPNKPNDFAFYTVFSAIKFNAETGLTVCFSEEMRPYLLELQDGKYARLKLENSLALSSTYAINLLNYLLEYSFHGERHGGKYWREVGMDELRFVLNVPKDAYKGRIDKFRLRVLDNPIKEINTKLQYHIEYNVMKTGRKVTGFHFDITILERRKALPPAKKTIDAEPIEENCAAADAVPVVPVTPSGLLEKFIGYGVRRKKAEELLQYAGEDACRANLEYVLPKKGTTKNFAGMIVKAVEEDWAGQAAQDEEIRRREEEHEKEKARHEREAHETMQNLSKMLGGVVSDEAKKDSDEIESVGGIMKNIRKESVEDAPKAKVEAPAVAVVQKSEEKPKRKAAPKVDAETARIWKEVLSKSMDCGLEQSANRWLCVCAPVSLKDGVLTVDARNDFTHDWVNRKYMKALNEAAKSLDVSQIQLVALENETEEG